jgi:hypothetical protein
MIFSGVSIIDVPKTLVLSATLAFLLTGCGVGGDNPNLALLATEFAKEGLGDSVFIIPAGVAAVRVNATVAETASQNFVVKFNSTSVVSVSIGSGDAVDAETYQGELLVPDPGKLTTVEITISTGVTWSFVSFVPQ